MFLKHQISIYKLFLKVHWKLKTGVMAAKISALPSLEYIKYIQTENSYFKL